MAFKEHFAGSTFFPAPAEIIDLLERGKPTVQSTYRDPRKPYACEKCQDTGYAYIPQGQSKETKVERCQCKRRSA